MASIKSAVDRLIQNNMVLNGNDLSRIHFISIIDHAVKEICIENLVKKAFEATGVIPYDPSRIELSNFPSSSSSC